MTAVQPTTDSLAIARRIVERGWRPIPLDHPSHRRCIGSHPDEIDPKTKERTPFDRKECEAGVSGNGLPRESRRGKHPVGKWSTIAASDPSTKFLDWTFARRTVNVGIATKASRLFVVDEDVLDAFAAFCRELGHDVPTTYRVRTAKGWHWYFLAPAGVVLGNASGVLKARGMDVRGGKGEGGYVVAAGSLHHCGHVYEAEDADADVAPCPQWLVRLLADPNEVDEAHGAPGPAPDRAGPSRPDDVRLDTLAGLTATYRTHLAQVCTPGWRHSFFAAARDGWRLYDVGGLTLDQLVDELNAVARQVWGADMDSKDEAIFRQEARRAATASPWEVLEAPERLERSTVDRSGHDRAESSTVSDGSQVCEGGGDRYADLNMDLTAFLDGEVDLVPTDRGLARKGDDLPLLYRGLTHMAVGETESGKSWLALACAVAEMAAGRRVLYVHFEESDPRGTILRLRLMGARREWFANGLFRFAGVEAPLAADRVANLVEYFGPDVPEETRGLAVLDGVNAAMALHGMNPDKADEYGTWDQKLARPLAATGAAVLSLDHVVKNPEAAQRGYAGGTVMKLNLISGASFLMESRDPLRPGAKGATSLYVAKDRPGSLRAVGEVKSGRRALLGTLWVDSTSALTSVSWTAPAPEEQAIADERPVDAKALGVLAVVKRLNDEEGRMKTPSTSEIRKTKGLGVSPNSVAGYLDALEAHGLVSREKGDGGTRWLHTLDGERRLLPPGVVVPEDA